MANTAWRNEKRRLREAEREAAEVAAAEERSDRREHLWNVPERARDAYIDMEDSFGPETVLEFMKAMYPEAEA
ncbi:hypothetical protein GGE68_002991 [Rhizobium leguminosarum]|uniref:hypothetical protein n=1 Tax=Rhizobium leguminosarum TaxID=384 RepID=UPI001614AFB8|nr:hypothetical protein [Rhizobium leguminosarum]MBB5664794.1 hypothetical protein [Rhizobium leguminosarum]